MNWYKNEEKYKPKICALCVFAPLRDEILIIILRAS